MKQRGMADVEFFTDLGIFFDAVTCTEAEAANAILEELDLEDDDDDEDDDGKSRGSDREADDAASEREIAIHAMMGAFGRRDGLAVNHISRKRIKQGLDRFAVAHGRAAQRIAGLGRFVDEIEAAQGAGSRKLS